MQAGNAAIGSTTPFLRTRYSQQSISHGSSQLSVNSSNPFDDEYETISQIGSPERSSIRHSARKKRRAPLPPNSVSKKNMLTLKFKFKHKLQSIICSLHSFFFIGSKL